MTMKRSLFRKRLPVLITAACLAVAATGVVLLMKHSPGPDASAKTETRATAAGATDQPAPKALAEAEAVVAPPSVSVRGEIITAHLATVPESVWHESAPAQPPYAV